MITRRRTLAIIAGASLLPAFGTHASPSTRHWKGIALGAEAFILLDHPEAERLLPLAVAEIHRLEAIFSLYQKDSQLARLNRQGSLANPDFDLLELLSLSGRFVARTKGAFDPSIQALWELYTTETAKGRVPDAAQIANARDLCGWRHVRLETDAVRFDREGVKLTLNGIAQGYIADKVSALLHRNGVENVLVNTGEITALGQQNAGQDWEVTLPDGQKTVLKDRAIATSSPLGTVFDQSSALGHLFDPASGRPAGKHQAVSVVAHTATEADALSTAFCLMEEAEITAVNGDHQTILHR